MRGSGQHGRAHHLVHRFLLLSASRVIARSTSMWVPWFAGLECFVLLTSRENVEVRQCKSLAIFTCGSSAGDATSVQWNAQHAASTDFRGRRLRLRAPAD